MCAIEKWLEKSEVFHQKKKMKIFLIILQIQFHLLLLFIKHQASREEKLKHTEWFE
jgi:hypothetical protein